MMEILQAAFLPINVVFTVLLLLVVLYWLLIILGLFDNDIFEIDLDSDVDIDIDADVDADFDGAGPLRAMLEFFYIGEVPVMIIVSILIMSMWAFSMIVNHYANPAGSMLVAMPILAGNLLFSILICKVITMPLRKVFGVFNKDSNASRKVMGRICTVVTTEISDNLGQAEMSSKGAPILLNVMAQQGCVFHKGDEAVVVENDKEKGVYIIAPVELEK